MPTDLHVDGLGYLSAEKGYDTLGFVFVPKMIPGGTAAPQLVMLPQDMDPLDPMPGIVQTKANGIRALALPDTIVTREGVPMNCARKAKPGLERMEKVFGQPMVFDGEWVEPGDFNATLRAFQLGAGEGVFWIFDAVPFAEWAIDRCTKPIEKRIVDLAAALDAARSPHVGMLSWEEISTPEMVDQKTREAWLAGHEGIVSKKLGSRYQRRRSGDWRRWKQTLTIDCTVMDTLHKNGRLRGIMVRGPGGPLTVSTGWTEAEAKRLEIDQEALIEVAYNPMPGTVKPRHARFVRFRDDKGRRSE